jgi:hypothetical protein
VFDNRVLRGIFGPKRDEKLHHEKIHNLFSLKNVKKSPEKKDEIGRACSMHRNNEECIQNFGGGDRRKKTSRNTVM